MSHKIRRLLSVVAVLLIILLGYSFYTDQVFAQWQQQFRGWAISQGIQEQTLNLAFRGLQPDAKVLRLDAHHPEFTRPVWTYLEQTVSQERIQVGQALLLQQADLLQQIEQQYGVQKEYLLAIWGVESSFGQQMGQYSVIRSLATLAYAGRAERRTFWRQQLLDALRILQAGDMTLKQLQGSWAGAIGHTQFMPSTFLQYAVDFDGDGKRNLTQSLADALASTAHYLQQSGWQRGQIWGEEIQLPPHFNWSLADPNHWQALAYWSGQGVELISGVSLAAWRDEMGCILLPAGHRGPAFLTFQNFKALLRYNNATNYALAVGSLGDQIRGSAPILATWPREDRELSRLEKAELQGLLSAVGYSTDGVDGLIGANTRAALRLWQADVGLPADGYPTFEQLELLREQTEFADQFGLSSAGRSSF